MYARSKHVSASSDEVEYARLDGADIVYGKAIAEINETGPLFKTAIFDEDDKVVGYEEGLDQAARDTGDHRGVAEAHEQAAPHDRGAGR